MSEDKESNVADIKVTEEEKVDEPQDKSE